LKPWQQRSWILPRDPTFAAKRKFSALRVRIPCGGAGFGLSGWVGLWLLGELDVEQFERLGLDLVGGGQALEGVFAGADAQLVAADRGEL
jgi:hypothetical protein